MLHIRKNAAAHNVFGDEHRGDQGEGAEVRECGPHVKRAYTKSAISVIIISAKKTVQAAVTFLVYPATAGGSGPCTTVAQRVQSGVRPRTSERPNMIPRNA